MDATAANTILRELVEALCDENTLPFAAKHLRDGDPIPAAWVACTDADVLVCLYFQAEPDATDPPICMLCFEANRGRCSSRWAFCAACGNAARALLTNPTFALFNATI